jgi:hypothetical protein
MSMLFDIGQNRSNTIFQNTKCFQTQYVLSNTMFSNTVFSNTICTFKHNVFKHSVLEYNVLEHNAFEHNILVHNVIEYIFSNLILFEQMLRLHGALEKNLQHTKNLRARASKSFLDILSC